MRLNRQIKQKLNVELYYINKRYYNAVPLKDIFEVLKSKAGIIVVDEDGQAWSGFLFGEDSKTTFNLFDTKTMKPVTDTMLVLSWYKMPNGKYEITSYLS